MDKEEIMSLPRNPTGESYGPTTGNPVLYPPGTEHFCPTVRTPTRIIEAGFLGLETDKS
jgi:hypothetical protein